MICVLFKTIRLHYSPNFRIDVVKIVTADGYTHGRPSWARAWWDEIETQVTSGGADETREERLYRVAVERTQHLVHNIQANDLPADERQHLPFIRALIVAAIDAQLDTESLFPRLQQILEPNKYQMIVQNLFKKCVRENLIRRQPKLQRRLLRGFMEVAGELQRVETFMGRSYIQTAWHYGAVDISVCTARETYRRATRRHGLRRNDRR